MLSNKAKKIDIKFLLISIFLPILFLTTASVYAKKNTSKIEVNSEANNLQFKPETSKISSKKQGTNTLGNETSEQNKIKQDKKAKREKIKQDKKAKKEKAITGKKKHKAFRDLGYEDLKVAKERLLKEGKKDVVIKHIEKMIPLCDNIQELRDLSLEISDLLFDSGELKKAENLYSQFCQSYPGDKNIEYANYRAILCNYWLTLDKERDQSGTRNTITLAQSFLDRSEIFTQYQDDVNKILVDCQSKLLESEISIFKEYLNLGDQLSAKTRLACIEKEFSAQMPQLEPKLIALSCAYAEKFNDQNLLNLKQQELDTKFPNWKDEPIIMADNKSIKEKKSFLNRF